ncbi:transglutaminase-like cysteine peptidase [Crenobacter caeni]|uniref:Transglutaminase n=1 Tax=Crenobacter caeni TaxID=2705474 RepID=A0A6B2KTK3_9NEIS|nr:transglutaminase-like cysteine peptidase [Crenobacter caeni]NDV13562.1 transglutaminase [Crenobacter caeni]
MAFSRHAARLSALLAACVLAALVVAVEVPGAGAVQRYGPQAVTLYREWRSLLGSLPGQDERSQLQAVNQFFNRKIRFADDRDVWGESDYWTTPFELFGKGAGDCEDFTIGKYVTLRLAGVAPDKLRLTYVRARIGDASSRVSQAHMVLAYYPQPNAEPLILDNLVGSLLPASQRDDLTPVFSFNAGALWVGNQSSNVDRLTRWRQLLDRMKKDGLNP